MHSFVTKRRRRLQVRSLILDLWPWAFGLWPWTSSEKKHNERAGTQSVALVSSLVFYFGEERPKSKGLRPKAKALSAGFKLGPSSATADQESAPVSSPEC